ncbi:MAG TPA: transcriptional regulator [Thermoplasmatales archaeon]|nr:transcriptional regulator [Thermoplasmatales archaeon]
MQNVLNIYIIQKIMNFEKIRSRLAGIFQKFGIKSMDADILAHLMIENRPLCACELGERLNYSISGVTSSLHRLMKNHLVVREKLGKKYFYRVDGHLLSALLHLMEELLRHDFQKLKAEIKNVSKMGRCKEKLKELVEGIEEAENQLKLMVKSLKYVEEANI